jgi:hypothetical protein
MTQQTSLRFGRRLVELAIAATALTGLTLMTGMAPGQATELPTPLSSEQSISNQAADLGESMQAACVTVTPLQSRVDCPVGGELFLSVDSEKQTGETLMRFDLQDGNEDRSDGVTLFRILF